MTNLRGGERDLSDLYARRFNIEEFFRDMKGERLGWGLRDCRITTADRLDRLLRVLAYLLLTGLGLWAKKHLRPRQWCSTISRTSAARLRWAASSSNPSEEN